MKLNIICSRTAVSSAYLIAVTRQSDRVISTDNKRDHLVHLEVAEGEGGVARQGFGEDPARGPIHVGSADSHPRFEGGVQVHVADIIGKSGFIIPA